MCRACTPRERSAGLVGTPQFSRDLSASQPIREALRAFARTIAKAGVAEAVRCGPTDPMSKSSDKPKKQQKQKPQKTLKERRSEKRAAKKLGSSSLLPADK